jgi:two-component system sensor histidine kinase AlgZ
VLAEQAIEDLAELFRVSLSDARTQISLEEEIDVARNYQRIEQLRLGERLQVRWDVDALPAGAPVPALLLQPLLENAIYHGIEPLAQGGTVHVGGWLEGDSIVIEVVNPTAGPTRRVSRQGHRMALDNVRQRLELAYPGRSAVEVDEAEQSFSVRLRFPRPSQESGTMARRTAEPAELMP